MTAGGGGEGTQALVTQSRHAKYSMKLSSCMWACSMAGGPIASLASQKASSVRQSKYAVGGYASGKMRSAGR